MAGTKRARLESASVDGRIVLSGGHAEKQRTIDKYRAAECVDAEIQPAGGTPILAHRIVLMASSE